MNPFESKSAEDSAELDKIFDLIIIFISIFSAALFQHVSAIIPLQVAANKTTLDEASASIMKNLKILFVPLLLVIFVWVISRTFAQRILFWRKTLAQFCFDWALITVWVDTLYFGVLSFPSPGVFWIIFFSTLGLITAMQLIISLRYEGVSLLIGRGWLKTISVLVATWIIYGAVFVSL